ncbi:MAG: glutamine--tRNA ligase/YqeY domain fusion protein [Peptoniphilaceae bacterium]|nr:glutamine--tRNA ligase/YqeY domain fusion protein [Peptoniphilaceae bacterium]
MNDLDHKKNLISQPEDSAEVSASNFIHQIIDDELKPEGRVHGQTIHTRFPPEPNGYLHIGHAKAICVDFGTALKYNGLCNLRMDDTNPIKEDVEYVESIQEDIRWLGFDWEDRFYFASDYFEQMYEFAIVLIKKGLAYVDDLSADELREYRGTLTEPGKNSPYRNRGVEENLKLFEQMRHGDFPDGSHTLRAKIDMTSGNMNMRDPVLYRISHEKHHRTGNEWCIYPMYDFAHPLEDAIEGITHSLCTLEFESHRPLYNWVVEHCDVPHRPRQIEFARLNITNTVMSKRKLRTLVEENYVDGWDDPRLPTISGLRRRGYTPKSIRTFSERIGVAKVDSTVDARFLDYCVREDLNDTAPRAMAVLDPIKLIIDNFPQNETVECTVRNHPRNESMGSHTVLFERELWIEREDFMIDPPKKYFRLFPGNEVRLQSAFIIRCTDYETDETGNVTVVHAEYDPSTTGGNAPADKKIKGTIHWLPVHHCVPCEIRLYESLFSVENPDQDGRDYLELLNPNSLTIVPKAYIEPWIEESRTVDMRYQFMRKGYFCEDRRRSTKDHPVFNRIVTLRDGYKPQ